MAHTVNFNEQTRKHGLFSVKEKAWHGLGQIVEEYPPSTEAIKHAGLDYTVEKRKLFTYDNENNNVDPDVDIIIPEIEVPNFYATRRTNTEQVLGVVGKDHEVVQNIDAFSFFDSIVSLSSNSFSISLIVGKLPFSFSGIACVSSYYAIPIGLSIPRKARSATTLFLSLKKVFLLKHSL